MTIRLRPHHLLCFLTYVGEGYNKAFIVNFNAIMSRLRQGEEIIVVSGPDDICAPLVELDGETEPHCFDDRIRKQDCIAAHDVSKILQYNVAEGTKIILGTEVLHKMRQAFKSGQVRRACRGCSWHKLCDDVAADNYAKTLIKA